MIDITTKPICEIKEKKFEWGEPYEIFTSLFNFDIGNSKTAIEASIDFYGKNNFKIQLTHLFNTLLNREEFLIVNYNMEIFDREALLVKIKFYLEDNKDKITPWDKYNLPFDEIYFIEDIKNQLPFLLNYINNNSLG